MFNNFLNKLYIPLIYSLFLFSYLNLFEREYIEFLSIIASIIILIIYKNIKSIKIVLIFFIYIILRIFYYQSLLIGVYDLAAISLLIYISNFKFEISYVRFLIIVLSLLNLSFGAYNFFSNITVDGGRVSGIFPSSLHYAYIITTLAIANYLISKNNVRILIGIILFLCAILSGSRAGSLCAFLILYLFIIEKIGFYYSVLFIFILFLCFFDIIISIRSLNFNEISDFGRIQSYLDWLMRIDLSTFIFGDGRYFTGSVGKSINPDSLITESSLLTFIESYGILITLLLLSAPLHLFKRSLFYDFKLVVSLLIFYLLILFNQFLETPSILFINTLILCSTFKIYINLLKIKNEKNLYS